MLKKVPVRKLFRKVFGLAWASTVFLAIAGFAQIALPRPLDALSLYAVVLFTHLLTPAVFLPLFLVGWLIVCKELARRSGWAELAEAYSFKTDGGAFAPDSWTAISGYAGELGFSKIYRAGASKDGILLSANPVFRIGHPPLLLPWSVVSLTSDDSSSENRGLLSKAMNRQYVSLRVSSSPEFVMRIAKSDFDRTNIYTSYLLSKGV